MKTTLLILFAWVAMLAWFATALAIERHRERVGAAAIATNADFRRCMPVDSGPLLPPRKPVLYPHNSEIS